MVVGVTEIGAVGDHEACSPHFPKSQMVGTTEVSKLGSLLGTKKVAGHLESETGSGEVLFEFIGLIRFPLCVEDGPEVPPGFTPFQPFGVVGEEEIEVRRNLLGMFFLCPITHALQDQGRSVGPSLKRHKVP